MISDEDWDVGWMVWLLYIQESPRLVTLGLPYHTNLYQLRNAITHDFGLVECCSLTY